MGVSVHMCLSMHVNVSVCVYVGFPFQRTKIRHIVDSVKPLVITSTFFICVGAS